MYYWSWIEEAVNPDEIWYIIITKYITGVPNTLTSCSSTVKVGDGTCIQNAMNLLKL